MLFLLCLVGGGASEPSSRVDAVARLQPRKLIEYILTEDMALKARKKALAPYIGVGRSESEIEKLLPARSSISGSGLGVRVVVYGSQKKPGLTVEYYLDGECYKVVYRDKNGKSVTLWTDGIENPLGHKPKAPAKGK
jgi:hypothetical protein